MKLGNSYRVVLCMIFITPLMAACASTPPPPSPAPQVEKIEATDEAIEAASIAFPKWRATSPLVRFEALDRIGSEILARVDDLGDMLAREEGKTLPEAKAEAHRAGHLFKYFAAEAYRTSGDIYQSLREGVSLKVLREPIGVVGVITPWNFTRTYWKMS